MIKIHIRVVFLTTTIIALMSGHTMARDKRAGYSDTLYRLQTAGQTNMDKFVAAQTRPVWQPLVTKYRIGETMVLKPRRLLKRQKRSNLRNQVQQRVARARMLKRKREEQRKLNKARKEARRRKQEEKRKQRALLLQRKREKAKAAREAKKAAREAKKAARQAARKLKRQQRKLRNKQKNTERRQKQALDKNGFLNTVEIPGSVGLGTSNAKTGFLNTVETPDSVRLWTSNANTGLLNAVETPGSMRSWTSNAKAGFSHTVETPGSVRLGTSNANTGFLSTVETPGGMGLGTSNAKTGFLNTVGTPGSMWLGISNADTGFSHTVETPGSMGLGTSNAKTGFLNTEIPGSMGLGTPNVMHETFLDSPAWFSQNNPQILKDSADFPDLSPSQQSPPNGVDLFNQGPSQMESIPLEESVGPVLSLSNDIGPINHESSSINHERSNINHERSSINHKSSSTFHVPVNIQPETVDDSNHTVNNEKASSGIDFISRFHSTKVSEPPSSSAFDEQSQNRINETFSDIHEAGTFTVDLFQDALIGPNGTITVIGEPSEFSQHTEPEPVDTTSTPLPSVSSVGRGNITVSTPSNRHWLSSQKARSTDPEMAKAFGLSYFDALFARARQQIRSFGL